MRELRVNILEHLDKFQLVCLAVSCYQKKMGEIVVPKEGMMREFVNKFPELPKLFGNSVGKYGNCPGIVYSVPSTKSPTKIMSFPITPTSLRVEDPQTVVIARLAKRFKPFTLLPGWLLRPRLDMVEFSCIKLLEIIKYFKLKEVAVVMDTFGLGEGDEEYSANVKDMMVKYFVQSPVSLCSLPTQEEIKRKEPEKIQTMISSSYKEDTSEEENF
jgi:hypothetical protein